MFVFDKSALSLAILFHPKFNILRLFPIFVHLNKLLLIFGFPKNVIVLGRGIKQIEHHVIADNSGHVSLDPLLYLSHPNGFPKLRQK
jgi:hypothetical protein